MSQIFPRSANAVARMTIVGAIASVAGLVTVVYTLMYSSWATKQNEVVDQPIQFSHAHHVGGVGLDCRYCHTSVENSSFAGIPPTQDVHELPFAALDECPNSRAGAGQPEGQQEPDLDPG